MNCKSPVQLLIVGCIKHSGREIITRKHKRKFDADWHKSLLLISTQIDQDESEFLLGNVQILDRAKIR